LYLGKETIFHPWKNGDILIASEIEVI
jgi:hypothetical protein